MENTYTKCQSLIVWFAAKKVEKTCWAFTPLWPDRVKVINLNILLSWQSMIIPAQWWSSRPNEFISSLDQLWRLSMLGLLACRSLGLWEPIKLPTRHHHSHQSHHSQHDHHCHHSHHTIIHSHQTNLFTNQHDIYDMSLSLSLSLCFSLSFMRKTRLVLYWDICIPDTGQPSRKWIIIHHGKVFPMFSCSFTRPELPKYIRRIIGYSPTKGRMFLEVFFEQIMFATNVDF